MKTRIVCQCGLITTNDIDKYIEEKGFPNSELKIKNLRTELSIGIVCELCLNDNNKDTVDITLNNYLKELQTKN